MSRGFGEKVRKYRKRNDITQAQLAEALEISVNYLSLIERNKKIPGRNTLVKLANKMNVSTDSLLSLDTHTGVAMEVSELSKKISSLTPKNKEFVLELLDFLLIYLE